MQQVSKRFKLLYADSIVGGEGRSGEVVEYVIDVIKAQLLPAGIDLNRIVLGKLVDHLIDLGLNALREFQIGIDLVMLISYERCIGRF